jgi:hypothetical protein
MANEVKGTTLKYFQNSVEQAVRKVDYDRNFTMLDSTTSATTGVGTESTPGRAKTTITIETDLLSALGAEITTGTLTAGNKYLVTASASSFDGTHAVGTIFVSDGTEECSSTEKVKLLGTKQTGKEMSVTIGGSAFAVQQITYETNYNELDATTSATAAPNMESTSGRAKRTTQFTCLMYRTTADQIVNAAPSGVAVVLTFASGITVSGTAILHQVSITDEVNGIVQVTYNAEWQGVPTDTGIGYLTLATQQAAEIIYETGSSTNKEITGNVILLTRSVSSDTNGDTLITYTGVFNGAITPAVYS